MRPPAAARLAATLPAALFAALLAAPPAAAQNVSLQGMMGGKALLVINGGRPRALAPGESAQGVKVISAGGEQAVVMADGKQLTLRVGATPVDLGGASSPGSGRRVVLSADTRGHFVTNGSINDGLDYKGGQPVGMHTANGVVRGWLIRAGKVRVGDVTVHDVETVVTPLPMPAVLLGNSFLNRFNMRREGSQMTLEKRS